RRSGRAVRSVPPDRLRCRAPRRGARNRGAAGRGGRRPGVAPRRRPMIRINLIAGERRAAKAPGRTLELGHKVTLAGTALLLVTALLIGWRFWALGQTEAELDAAIAAARSEEARLAEILTQVAQFESQSAQL